MAEKIDRITSPVHIRGEHCILIKLHLYLSTSNGCVLKSCVSLFSELCNGSNAEQTVVEKGTEKAKRFWACLEFYKKRIFVRSV